MGHLVHDVRFALRLFRKNPGFAATAICSLALGIGGSSAIFSVVNAAILRPIPFADADQLVVIRDVPKGAATTPISYPKFQAWRDQRDVFEEVGAYTVGADTFARCASHFWPDAIWKKQRSAKRPERSS